MSIRHLLMAAAFGSGVQPHDGTRHLPVTAGVLTQTWAAVTYGGGQFVAVGSTGTSSCMTSPDGVTWTGRTATLACGSITYGAGIYVAFPYSGGTICMTSPDGAVWTTRTGLPVSATYVVTFGNGTFVAVPNGSSTTCITSPDGINWTSRTISATAYTWRSVTFGGGQFVAVGTSACATSPDGITWTMRTITAANHYSVAYGGGMYVTVATGTVAASSPDGITWTARVMPSSLTWYSVAWGNGAFVAVGNSGSANANAARSVDGINWATVTTMPTSYWRGNCYGNGRFVSVAAISSAGNVAVSTTDEGFIWNKTRTLPAGGQCRAVSYANGQYLGVSSITATYVSTDGITFTAAGVLPFNFGNGRCPAYGNGTWVVLNQTASANDCATSPDGATWTLRSTGRNVAWITLAFGAGLFVGCASSSYATSPDGITWTARTLPGGGSGWKILYANGLFFAFNNTGSTFATSVDGLNWTPRTSLPSQLGTRIEYLASASTYLCDTNKTSKDGITWTTRGMPSGVNTIDQIVALGDKFLFFGDDVQCAGNYYWHYLSVDGILWYNLGQGAILTTTCDVYSAVKGPQRIVAFPYSGTTFSTAP